MKKSLLILLCLAMTLLCACVWTTRPIDPLPDAPVVPDKPASEQEEIPPAEETPEEIPAEDPAEIPDAPDLSAIQAQVEAFLQTPGVNGLICGGGNWPIDPVRLREVVYQLSDEAFPYDEVVAAYEADGGEVHTDLSYASSAKLDALLLAVTGYGLYENGVISPRWNLQDVPYFPALDLYCIQHGDTNYQPFTAQVTDYDEDTHLTYVRLTSRLEDMDLFCFIGDEFTFCQGIDLVLSHTGEKEFRILSIRPDAQ